MFTKITSRHMITSSISRMRIVLLICSSLAWLATELSGDGAELRTTAGRRRVTRQVNYQPPADPDSEPEPEAQPKSAIDPGADEMPNAEPQDVKPRSAAPKAKSVVPNGGTKSTPKSQGMPPQRVQPNVESVPNHERHQHGYSSLPSEPMFAEGESYEDWNEPGSCYAAACGPCFCGNGWWADVDVLMWWRSERFVPPLVASGPLPTTLPNATVLFGGTGIGGEARPGGRVNFGMWLDPCQMGGVGGRFFALADETVRFNETSDAAGNPIFGVPFFNAQLNREDTTLVAFPAAAPLLARTGSVDISSSSKVLGADAYLRRAIYRDGRRRVDLVAGYQMSRIDEDLSISIVSTDLTNNFRQYPLDVFQTRNQYHAGTFGWMTEFEGNCWKLSSLVKVGFGNMNETVVISGGNLIEAPIAAAVNAQPARVAPGLFAQASNIGTHQQSTFAVSPEINVNWVCHVTDRVDVSVGYSFIYWSHVAQPGNQIDRRIDVAQLQALPAFTFNSSDYWVNGVNLGAQYRF